MQAVIRRLSPNLIKDDFLKKVDHNSKYSEIINQLNSMKFEKTNIIQNKGEFTIKVTNIGGPLNHLENTWHFKEQENGTEISFDIDFEIENKFLNIVMTKSFQFGLDKIADAFQKRAEDLFSNR